METRNTKLIIGAAGGTAGKNSKTYKISIPSKWVNEMALDKGSVELVFDGRCITVKGYEDAAVFVENKKKIGHDLIKMCVSDGETLCSVVIVDITDQTVKHENFTEDLTKTPFGNNKTPTIADFYSFLEERCIPRSRAGLREYLDVLDIAEYDPLEIVKKTHGIMAEDNINLDLERI